MCIVTDGSEKKIPSKATLLSNNGISKVWRGNDGWIYKRSIPFLIENELGMLKIMAVTGFVPAVERYDKYTLKIRDLGESETVTNKRIFKKHFRAAVKAIKDHGIRHGDLTTQAVIVKNNKPFIIDWAEARLLTDMRPNKRPGGDEYWMEKTMEAICE